MLRIGQPPQAPPPPDAGPDPEMLAQLMQGGQDAPPDQAPSKLDAQKTTQAISGYLGPESGPFQCGNCIHFEDPGSCGLVAGPIDPQGCCNLFESTKGPHDADHDIDQESPIEDQGEGEDPNVLQ